MAFKKRASGAHAVHGIKQQSFVLSILIVLTSQVAVKLLGMIYRLVITNMEGFGDLGNGYLNAGYQIYVVLLAVSSVGIPNAISKLVSERMALGDPKGAHRIFKVALLLFSVIGGACSLTLFLGARLLADYVIKMSGTVYTLRALSPAIFFVCVSSVIRGYFVGLNNVNATSTSQVLEQIFKCVLTILFVRLMVGHAPEFMAAAANFASTTSTFLCLIYLTVFYYRNRAGIMYSIEGSTYRYRRGGRNRFGSRRDIMKTILWLSIPISLSSIITSVARVIDTSTISYGIADAFRNGIPGILETPTAEMLEREAVRLSGQLSKSDVLINLPLAMNVAFATVLVPTVARAFTLKDYDTATNRVSFSLVVSMVLVLPCAVGFMVLGDPIFKMLYPAAPEGAYLLQITAFAMIFMALDQTINGALQGMGKVFVPAVALLFGALAKIIANNVLIRIPSINITGAAIGTVICHVIAFSIEFTVLSRSLKLRLPPGRFLIKPVAAAAVMGAGTYVSYHLLHWLTHSNSISVILSIIVAVVIYLAMVLILKVLSLQEISELPKGQYLVRLLQKLPFYRNDLPAEDTGDEASDETGASEDK